MSKNIKRIGQKDDETACEFIRRAIDWMEYESCTLLDQLPSVDAALDFFGLWHTYGTDMWNGVLECIAEGDDPKPALDFCRKYNLKNFKADVKEAMSLKTSL